MRFTKPLLNVFSVIILSVLTLALNSCASTVQTSAMTADERFAYAKSLFDDENTLEAMREFEAITLQYPGSEVVDDAQFYLGMSRFERSEYLIAASEFSRLINNMTASPLVAEAQFMLAECYYQLSPKYPLDQRFTRKANEEFQAFIDFFPTDKRVEEAENKISELSDKLAMKEFNAAEIYERMEYYNAALFYYKMIMEVYHDTPYASRAAYNMIQILLIKDRTDEAIKEINNFLIKFPTDPNYERITNLKASLQGS